MLRKILLIIAVMSITVFCLNGCKKDSGQRQTSEEEIKIEAEYKAQAEEQINKDNMAEELDKIEKSIEQESDQ